ncbi:retrovirus-related pol polyprotein from transposon TNT 1-94 [Tanacetum coccineum]
MAISSSSSSSSSDSEKVVKETDELKGKIAKWEESTKNLDEILNSQMSARDKTSLGYDTQLNELSSNHETDSENSLSIFDARSRNFLTPRADISFTWLDEYAIRNKIIESQTTKLNTKTSETAGQTNDANTEKPKSASESVVSNPKINRDRVIIEDWNSDDEEEVNEVQIVRPETQTVKTRDDKSGQNSQKQGISFRKVKAYFVCKSTEHLIKDCNFHDKKSQEPKLKNVVNTGQREGKPVWDNTKRVNHQNFSKYPHLSKTFVPSGVLTRTGLHRPSVSTARPVCTARPSVSTARPVCTARPSVSTARPVCTARPSVSTARPVYATRPIYPRMDNVRPRGSCSPIKRSYYTKPAFRPKDLKQDVKTFGVQNMTTAGTRAVVNTGKGKLDTDLKKSRWVWRPKGNYLDHVSKDSGSFMLKKGNPEILLQDHAVVDSGCSSHMTGNKAYLSDYEDFNGGFVAFGSDPKGGKITGKGKIKTANLDFDDVYFVDELKFNLFSVSQMCDKKNSVLFTESECLILSPSFKLLDESQVVLRAPRKDDVYSLDLKNIVPSGGITCLYANATADESKLWHRRLGHVNFKNINKLVKGHLVRGLPSKVFVNDHTCVASKKGKSPSISFMRPFGCPLTILNTLNSLGKFDGKSDEGYLLGYSTSRTGPNWMFDLDFLTNSMNYIPVSVENQVNVDASTQDYYVAAAHEKPSESSPKDNDVPDSEDDDKEEQHQMKENKPLKKKRGELHLTQKKAAQATSTNRLSIDRQYVSTDRPSVSTNRPFVSIDRSNTPYVSAASTPTGANAVSKDFGKGNSNFSCMESLKNMKGSVKLYDEFDKLPIEGESLLNDPVDAINHMMSFLTAVVTSRYPTTNNQLRNSSNPRQQATINNGREQVETILENKEQLSATTAKGKATCPNRCTKTKEEKDDSWFKDKVLLVQAQESGQILHEEELAFLADPGILEGQATPYFALHGEFISLSYAAVEQHRLESKTFEVKMNQALNENERLLEQVMSKDIVNLIVNYSMDIASVNVHECEKCLKLETELLNKKGFFDTQLNQEILQRDNSVSNQIAPSSDQLFELNELKARVRKKKTWSRNLRLSASGSSLFGNTKKDQDSANTKVIQIVLWYLDSGCSKHMTRDRSQLTNFVNKFLGTVKFRNDHVAKILGYDDYQIGNVTISRVYYVEGLGHNLFSVGQFCDSNLEVAFRQHTCFIRNLEGVDLLTGSRGNNLYTLVFADIVGVSPIRSPLSLILKRDHRCSACAMGKARRIPTKPKLKTPIKKSISIYTWIFCGQWSVASVNGKKYILIIVDELLTITWIYAKAPLFLWAEAVATMLHPKSFHHTPLSGKTPYELLHDKLPDLSFFHVFGALCYPTNDSENLGKLQPKGCWIFGFLMSWTAMGLLKRRSGPALHEMTPATISSGLVPNPPPSTPFVPPSRTNWDMLFQMLFDELLNPPPSVDHPAPEVVAPMMSTQLLSTRYDVEEDNHDIEVAHMGNDPYFGDSILEVPSDQSS